MGTSTLRGAPQWVKSARKAGALVLAAGQSRRFGGDKLLAPLRGRPLACHAFGTAAAARDEGAVARAVAVVANDGVRALALDTGLEPVWNDTPASGVGRSLQLGLDYLAGTEVSAVLIFLADQPLVRLDVVRSLVTAWHRENSLVVRPCYEAEPQVPGHPVLLDRSAWWLRNRLAGDVGLSSLLGLIGVRAELVAVPGRNPDIDTLAELHTLENSS